MFELTFTDRESYLAWRAEWRASYKTLSTEIHEKKKQIAQAFKDNDPKAGFYQNQCSASRALAHRMMELRKEANARRDESRAAKLQQAA